MPVPKGSDGIVVDIDVYVDTRFSVGVAAALCELSACPLLVCWGLALPFPRPRPAAALPSLSALPHILFPCLAFRLAITRDCPEPFSSVLFCGREDGERLLTRGGAGRSRVRALGRCTVYQDE